MPPASVGRAPAQSQQQQQQQQYWPESGQYAPSLAVPLMASLEILESTKQTKKPSYYHANQYHFEIRSNE